MTLVRSDILSSAGIQIFFRKQYFISIFGILKNKVVYRWLVLLQTVVRIENMQRRNNIKILIQYNQKPKSSSISDWIKRSLLTLFNYVLLIFVFIRTRYLNDMLCLVSVAMTRWPDIFYARFWLSLMRDILWHSIFTYLNIFKHF